MDKILTETLLRALRYIETLDQRGVFPDAKAIARLAAFDEPAPEHPADPQDVVTMLDNIGAPGTVAMSGNRYFGFVIGGTLPAALAANILTSVWDQNGALRVMSPTSATLEDVTLRWMKELLGLPAETGGGFVTGATMANFAGLAAARHALLSQQGWDVEADGLFGAPPINVYVGEEVHISVLNALQMLGLGRDRVIRVPADNQGRMLPAAIPAISGPSIICLQAGNVNTGALDPARDICEIARAAGAWTHVDGAFGLWAMMIPSLQSQAAGYDLADSWALDGHKWLNVSYDNGMVFVRDAAALRAAMSITAPYLTTSDAREPSHYVPEQSRRARAIEVWAALRSLGRAGLIEQIDRCCHHARRFATGLRDAGFEILNDVTLNQVMVSFGDEAKTKRVIEAIQQDGTCWCGQTIWRGRLAMRISVSSWKTTEEDVEKSLAAMIRLAT
ncbi:MAG: pyridoxal phosphate-dependent decarboxylase family protein [Blastocatellia bacterium]